MAAFQMSAIQTSRSIVALTRLQKIVTFELKIDLQLKGLYVADHFLAVWDGHKILIFDTDETGGSAIVGASARHCSANVYDMLAS